MKHLTLLLLTLLMLCALAPAHADESAISAGDYLGHWKAVRRELNGAEIATDLLTYGMEGFSITDESALYFLNESYMSADGIVEAPTYITACAWTSQPDGSIRVSGLGMNATLRLEGDALVTVPPSESGSRTVFTRVSADDMPAFIPADPADYLGTWTLSEALVGSRYDITQDVLAMGEMSLTLGAFQASICNPNVPMDSGGSCLQPAIVAGSWALEPDGRVIVTSDGFMRAYFPKDGTLVTGDDNGFTLRYTRQEPAQASSAIPSAEDYLGYWEVIRVEMDGVDITADALAYGGQGVTFHTDGALLHGTEVHINGGDVTATPIITPAAWVFQPDGSMDVLQAGHPLTFRHDGTHLRVEDQSVVFTYARAEAPAASDAATITVSAEDLLGRWKAVELMVDGTDMSAEALAVFEFTVTFEDDHAIVRMAQVAEKGDTSPAASYTYTCSWHIGVNGITVSDEGSGIHLVFQRSGEQLVYHEGDGQYTFARDEASAPSGGTRNEQSAFLSVFSHAATEQDKELILISAYASEKVYKPDEVKAYLKELGFPEDRIRHYDYDCDADHYVALTLASREITDAQGRTATLYAVITRGTVDTAEWISNFDMGNGDIALGFLMATQRALGHLADYMELYPAAGDAEPIFWLTGHSRGAAVINFIAGQFLSLPQERVYAVTFATPNVSKSTTLATNILNFVIDCDVVTNVPFTSWGFDRHGLTVHYTGSYMSDVALTSAGDMKILVDFLSQVSQDEYYEMTLEILHSEAITTRNAMTLSDMMMVNVLAIAGCTLDHGDETLLTGYSLIEHLRMNTLYQAPMRAILGDLLPNEQQATLDVLWGVIGNAGPCHSMSTYVKWIEGIYYGHPTDVDPTVPSGGGSVGSR